MPSLCHRFLRQRDRLDFGALQQIHDAILREAISVLPVAGECHIQRNRQDGSRADAALSNERHRATPAPLNHSATGVSPTSKGGLGSLAVLSDLHCTGVQVELIKGRHRRDHDVSEDRMAWLKNQRWAEGVW